MTRAQNALLPHRHFIFVILCNLRILIAVSAPSAAVAMQVPLLRLQCGANSYDWGKKGSESLVARFAAVTPAADFTVQADQPYAVRCGDRPISRIGA